MTALRGVALDVIGPERQIFAQLHIDLLPDTSVDLFPTPLLDLRNVPERDGALESVRLLEGMEYRYAFQGYSAATRISTDLPEIFAPDDRSGRAGRLKTGQFTGCVSVRVFVDGQDGGVATFEVRARKLDYLTDYRRMMADVAEAATEAVMERFAVSDQSFVPSNTGDPLTLYQRFTFLESLFSNEAFQAALQQVIGRPYESWETVREERRPGQGLRGHGGIAQELQRAGRRTAWPDSPIEADLPAVVQVNRTEPIVDNQPNQFVKFALTRWREVAQQLHDAMSRLKPTAATRRGIRESQELLDRLDAFLGEELFREVGNLVLFPGGSQVLQKREGYRDIMRAYVQFEVAAQLSWLGGEDVFKAGQRDVATLYEYWTYIQVARLLSALCGMQFDFGKLLIESDGQVGLSLQKGKRTVLSGSATRLGRKLGVELWYNKEFGGASGGKETSWIAGRAAEGSWTVRMRPDISVRISPDPGALEYCDPVWVHFDAKYRVEKISDLLDDADALTEQGATSSACSSDAGKSVAKREDLLKMHAYRDAIRLSAGAYVLYPGDQSRKRRAYTEVLPGLGAFKLRPHVTGEAEGTGELRVFLDELLTHAARQASQHERMRFWTSRVHNGRKVEAGPVAGPLFQSPPDDIKVLIGFVKNEAHAQWIRATGYYNLRADGRRGAVARDLLDCDVVLLWSTGHAVAPSLWRVGKAIEAMTDVDLRARGYPEPRGLKYYCLQLSEEVIGWETLALNPQLIADVIARISPSASSGAPLLLLWSQLVRSGSAQT